MENFVLASVDLKYFIVIICVVFHRERDLLRHNNIFCIVFSKFLVQFTFCKYCMLVSKDGMKL